MAPFTFTTTKAKSINPGKRTTCADLGLYKCRRCLIEAAAAAAAAFDDPCKKKKEEEKFSSSSSSEEEGEGGGKSVYMSGEKLAEHYQAHHPKYDHRCEHCPDRYYQGWKALRNHLRKDHHYLEAQLVAKDKKKNGGPKEAVAVVEEEEIAEPPREQSFYVIQLGDGEVVVLDPLEWKSLMSSAD